MNPGTAYPIKKQDQSCIPIYNIEKELPQYISSRKMVMTKPDNAQYQIMRVMKYKNWNCVSIINLSDIKDGSSNKFFSKLVKFEAHINGYDFLNNDIHSIFSDNRKSELKNILKLHNKVPIIVAWGKNTKLINLATKCINQLDERKIKGVKCDENKYLYSYASPQIYDYKVKWLKEMFQII
jgi:hypothetical protein